MVSAYEDPRIDDVERPQPIHVKAVPTCYQDLRTYRASRFECILCDFFEECQKNNDIIIKKSRLSASSY